MAHNREALGKNAADRWRPTRAPSRRPPDTEHGTETDGRQKKLGKGETMYTNPGERRARRLDRRASFGDQLVEVLDNARRSGATAVRIQTLDGGRISVEDDGCGIDHLEVAVAEGASAWGETVRRREHVAGLGLDRLLDSRARITTRVAGGAGQAIEPEEEHFREGGRCESRPADDGPAAHGTRVEWTPGQLAGREHRNREELAPKTAADWDLVLGEAISEAVEYYPLPVTLNGVPLAQRDFLAGAMLVHEVDGIRYGVYQEERNRDPLNVHGRRLLLAGMGPSVWTIDGRTFLTAIDVAVGHVPPLQEPDRWELAETGAAERLRKEGRLACLRAIAGLEQQPPLGYRDYAAATEAGIACRPAPARLRPWRGETVRGRRHRWSPQSAVERLTATDRIVVERSFPQHEEATLLEAMRTSGNAAMLLDSDNRLEGYPWYDRLPRLEHMRVEGRLHGRTLGEAELCEAWSTENAARLEEAHMVLTIRSGQEQSELRIPAEVLLMRTTSPAKGSQWPESDPGDARPLVTAGGAARTTVAELADLMARACFRLSEDDDADAASTQEERWAEGAAIAATAVLEGLEAAQMRQVRSHADAIMTIVGSKATVRIDAEGTKTRVQIERPSTSTGKGQ